MTLQKKTIQPPTAYCSSQLKQGTLLDSVKKASINCSKQTIEAFSFDIIAILINNKFLMTWMCFHIHITHFIHIHAQINLRSGNIGMS